MEKFFLSRHLVTVGGVGNIITDFAVVFSHFRFGLDFRLGYFRFQLLLLDDFRRRRVVLKLRTSSFRLGLLLLPRLLGGRVRRRRRMGALYSGNRRGRSSSRTPSRLVGRRRQTPRPRRRRPAVGASARAESGSPAARARPRRPPRISGTLGLGRFRPHSG